MSLEFVEAMQRVGLAMHCPSDLLVDGRLHRYRVLGDKSGSKNGWLVLDLSPPAHGAFGSWKTGQTHTWQATQQNDMTPAARQVLTRRMADARAARDAEQQLVHAAARDRAANLWARAKPACNEHPYLVRKGVGAFGIRDLRGQLVVPMRDAEGVLRSLQFIGADGRKTFLTGGRKRGCYHAIGRIEQAVCVCEGYATGATIYQATRHATAVAFDAGNLEPVARALRAKFPNLTLCVCADLDVATPGNPGLTFGRRAAAAVGGALAVPVFGRNENV